MINKYIKEIETVYSALKLERPTVVFNLHSFVKDAIKDYEQFNTVSCSIYIPSKNRANSVKTTKLLESANLDYTLVIEPQDFSAYLENFPEHKLLLLDHNNHKQGVRYARNFIKEYSITKKEKYHWQIDDDMLHFYLRENNKNIKRSIRTCLGIVEKTTKMFDNVAISGITSSAYAFSKELTARKNILAYGCVLVNNEIDQKWNDDTVEDWDYTLSVLERGYCTIAFNHICFATPSSGTNTGGNALTEYASKEIRGNFYKGFAKKWNKNFRVVNRTKHKGYVLEHKRNFFNDYKQELRLKCSNL